MWTHIRWAECVGSDAFSPTFIKSNNRISAKFSRRILRIPKMLFVNDGRIKILARILMRPLGCTFGELRLQKTRRYRVKVLCVGLFFYFLHNTIMCGLELKIVSILYN